MNTHTQKSVMDLINRAQCALHEANCFHEISTMLDSDIELPDHIHDFLYCRIRKSHEAAFDALATLEHECLEQKPAMKFETLVGGEQ